MAIQHTPFFCLVFAHLLFCRRHNSTTLLSKLQSLRSISPMNMPEAKQLGLGPRNRSAQMLASCAPAVTCLVENVLGGAVRHHYIDLVGDMGLLGTDVLCPRRHVRGGFVSIFIGRVLKGRGAECRREGEA